MKQVLGSAAFHSKEPVPVLQCEMKQEPVPVFLVNEPMSDDVACLDIEDAQKGRPSDDQVMSLIKEKTGATNSSAFQQLPDEIRRSVLIELKERKASLRQLERLTGIGKSLIYRMR